MDEIIGRWATDLDKYQKEFHAQAVRVKDWDQKLVENGEKIQKLYLETYEAERASNEIDRQLQSVESQQDELAAWLERYEREAEVLLNRHSGPGEQLSGPDQERERTYKLAERLIDRMDEMSKDMSKMIKEINDISGALSKTGKTDDPVSFPRLISVFAYLVLHSLTHAAEPNCAGPQRPPDAASVDRHKRGGAAGQGGSGQEEREQPGWDERRARERRGRGLLPVVHGAAVGGRQGTKPASRRSVRVRVGFFTARYPGCFVAIRCLVCLFSLTPHCLTFILIATRNGGVHHSRQETDGEWQNTCPFEPGTSYKAERRCVHSGQCMCFVVF